MYVWMHGCMDVWMYVCMYVCMMYVCFKPVEIRCRTSLQVLYEPFLFTGFPVVVPGLGRGI